MRVGVVAAEEMSRAFTYRNNKLENMKESVSIYRFVFNLFPQKEQHGFVGKEVLCFNVLFVINKSGER